MCFPFMPIMNDCSLTLIDSQVFPLGNQAFSTFINTSQYSSVSVGWREGKHHLIFCSGLVEELLLIGWWIFFNKAGRTGSIWTRLFGTFATSQMMGKSSGSAALMAPAIADHWWGLPHSFEVYCLPICCHPDISPEVQPSIHCTLTYRHACTHVHPETSHSLLISESTDGQHYCAQSECFHSSTMDGRKRESPSTGSRSLRAPS